MSFMRFMVFKQNCLNFKAVKIKEGVWKPIKRWTR